MQREINHYLRRAGVGLEQRFAYIPGKTLSVKNFDALSAYMRTKYHISLSEGFMRKDFEIARIICTGVDDVLTDFPKAKHYISEIAYGGKSPYLGKYEEYSDATQSRILIFSKSFHSCKRQAYSTAVHEAAHAVDISLGRKSETIINEALRKSAGRINGQEAIAQLRALLGSTHWDEYGNKEEIFAFSFELSYIKNANNLSETVLSIAKGLV